MKTARTCLGLALLAVAQPGCIDRFETESAYSAERYLCAPEAEAAYAEMIEQCRVDWEANASCGGILSFTGILEGKFVTVETRLEQTVYNFVGAAAAARRLDRIEIYGESPYFLIGFDLRSLGMDVASGASERTYSLHSAAEELPAHRGDELLVLGLRISVGGESVAYSARTGSGSIVLTPRSDREVAGSFDGGFAGGDFLEGCFHSFVLQQVVSRSGP